MAACYPALPQVCELIGLKMRFFRPRCYLLFSAPIVRTCLATATAVESSRPSSASTVRRGGAGHWRKIPRKASALDAGLNAGNPHAACGVRRLETWHGRQTCLRPSSDNRRLTVEIGIPSERAARVMLSNLATLTNIGMLFGSAVTHFAIDGNKFPNFPT